MFPDVHHADHEMDLTRAPRSIGTVLRASITVILVGVLVFRLRDERIAALFPRHWTASTIAWLCAGVATCLVGFGLSARRWQLVVRALEHEVRWRTLLGHTLAGQFAGNALPSTIGGDVVRISRATTTLGSSTDAFASVMIERLTGWIALPAWCALGFGLDPDLLDGLNARFAITVAAVTLAVLVGILFLAGHPRVAGRFAGHDSWMRFIGAVHTGVDALRRRPRLAAELIATALLYQLTTLLTFMCAFRALGAANLDLPVMLTFFPTVTMLQVLPVTIGGLGMRETVLVEVLKPFGIHTAQAIGGGLLWYCFNLIASLSGVGPFTRRPRTNPHRANESPSTTDVYN
ncbi:MAG: lysylphosphatidylglycerol synthase transmembrane domain-containing protein [Acidimicrobiia bacterium]